MSNTPEIQNQNATPDGWQGILDAGENILWQGRPNSKVKFEITHAFSFLFGLAFAGFAVFWMVGASQAGGGFWMFGLIHFFVGLSLSIGPPFYAAWRRKHTWYTLSSKRAFIATEMPALGRRMDIYPLNKDTNLSFDNGEPATIYFAETHKQTKNGSRVVKIGFERINDGKTVYSMIRKVQNGET